MTAVRATRPKPVLERTIENYLRDRCNEAGFMCLKFVSPSTAGVPDRLIIANGHVVFVELKRPGGKPRRNQVEMHERMRQVGADVRVIDNHKASRELVAELQELNPPQSAA